MKQFLRHIFLLVALFVATTNVWAECYVLEKYTTDSEEYITVNSNRDGSSFSGSFQVSNGYELTFSYRLSGSSSVSYDHYVAPQYSKDGVNFTDILPEGTISTKSRSWRHTKDDDKLTFILPSGTTHIRFRRRASSWLGTRDLYIKNVRVTRISSISASPTTFTFDPIPVSKTATKKVTINYSNIGTSVYASACDPADVATHFALTSAENLDCAGTVELTLTYQPQTEGTHGGTATISGSNGTSCTINVSGSAFAVVDPTHTWNDSTTYKVGDPNLYLANIWTSNSSGSITYRIKKDSFEPSGINNEGATPPSIINGNVLTLGQAGTLVIEMIQDATTGFNAKTSEQKITINKHNVEASIRKSTALWNEIIDNPFYLSYGLTDFDVESLNSQVAEYLVSSNQIQTYFTNETASFRISRKEDYKYKELIPTELKLKVEQNLQTACLVLDPCSGEFNCSLGGDDVYYTPGDFAEGSVPYQLFFTARKEYVLNVGGTGNVEIHQYVEGDWKYIDEFDPGKNETDYGPYNLDPKATRIRFFNTYGSYMRYFTNVRVTRKIDLNPQVEDDIFYLSQSSAAMTFEGTFMLDWSTCVDEIRLKSDNPMFEITPSVISVDANSHGSTPITIRANATNATSLTGELTIYDQTQKKTITLSCEHLLQQIHWTQYFNNLEATEEGVANEKFILDAVAKDVNGTWTNQPINYTLNITKNAENARVENGVLYITGVCEGSITASVEGFTAGNKTYSPDQLTHTIRVRKAGEPCNTEYILKDKIVLHTIQTSEALYVGDKNPDMLKYDAHKDVGANYFYVQYSTDGSNWNDWENPDLPSDNDRSFEHKVPEGTTHIRFQTRTGATLNKYIKNIKVTQHTELKPDVTQIAETITVNTPFNKEIKVRYSDIPLIQSTLTQNTTKLLVLSPKQEVNNNCGDFGEYTYTLSGMWTTTQIVEEELRFFTIAGDEKIVNISIVVQTGAQIETQKDNGDWNDPSTWTNGMVPNASTPVHINHNVTISSPAEVYSILVEKEKQITITSTGGLTVHAGGYKTFNQEEDLEITIDNDHAGYFRMSPEAKTATMPRAIVNFTTKGTLNGGGNDAAYQYIGAPGEGAATDILGTTVLYLRSEEKGWVRLKTFWAELEAFAGYALTQKAQPEFTFYPQLINEDKTIQLTYTSNGMQGDNLWANSYMAPLDITKFTPDDFTGNVTRTFYLYNSGSYDQWEKDTSSVSTAGEVPGRYYAIPVLAARALGDEAQTVVPPMQGVYMKAGEGGGEIKLSYEKHVWNNTQTAQMNKPLRIAGRNESAEKQNTDFQRVRLQVTSENSGADRMYIIQDSMATSGYDNGYDAPKQMADNLMNIYTNEPFGKMEISSTDNMNEMYIGFQAGDDSQYTMTFSSLIGDSLYLYDMEADEYIEMTENGKYQFSATPMSTNDLRFQLLVAPDLPDNAPEQGGDVATMIENLSTTKLWISDKMVYVTNVQPNSTLAIYGLGGICVAQYQIPEGMKNVQYPISNLPVGVYIIRLNDQACKFVCK